MVAPAFEGFQYSYPRGRYLGPGALKVLYAFINGEHRDSPFHRKISETVLIIVHILEFVESAAAKYVKDARYKISRDAYPPSSLMRASIAAMFSFFLPGSNSNDNRSQSPSLALRSAHAGNDAVNSFSPSVINTVAMPPVILSTKHEIVTPLTLPSFTAF
jgi:hypothetical protein